MIGEISVQTRYALACTCSLSALLATPVPGRAAEPGEMNQLEEVVILARKRTEPLQNVPVAVSVMSTSSVEARFSADLSDLGAGLPNIILDPAPAYANATAFSIRGMSFQDPDASFEPAVGVVLDGVFLGKANANLLDLYDVDQIEVLRGPQGTLFGKNTIGGLVTVRSRRPSGEFHAGASASIGNYGRRDLKAMLEMPLGDGEFSIRLSGLRKTMDGYYINEATGDRIGAEDSTMGRLVAVWRPGDAFDLTVIADIVRDKGDAAVERNSSPPGSGACFFGYCALTYGDLFRVRINDPNFIDSKTSGVAIEANWHFGPGTITWVSGLRHTDDRSAVDLDGDVVTLLAYPREQLINQFSQELRIATDVGEKLDYVAGLTYYKQWYTQIQQQIVDCTLVGACPPAVPVGAVQIPLGAHAQQDGKAYAVFAQANYQTSPRTRLTIGGRYSWEDKEFSLRPPGYNLAPPEFAPFVKADASFGELTPKLGFDFRRSDTQFWYLSYSTGFKAGGFNGRSNTVSDIGPYNPEKVRGVEAGLKAEWLQRRLRTNFAAFYNRYTDMQVDVIIPSDVGAGQQTVVRNAAEAYTAGFELESTLVPADGLMINVNLGYLRARYVDFLANLTPADFLAGAVADHSDLKLRRAPEWTGLLGLTYDIGLGSAGTLSLAGSSSYSSAYETDVTNDLFARRPAAWLVDASVAYQPASERLRLAVYVKNLTDRQFVDNGINAGGLLAFNEPNRPRTYGIELAVRY
ncbi:MAG: TonB-dependent receptor [Gammaproteobacteria bacterium]|nr:MAG: TonB-dependent receptor [Gammaproteobacteria bacterium]